MQQENPEKVFRKNVAVLLKCENQYVACYRQKHNVWQCVQGGVEQFDEDLSAAIHREICEELGMEQNNFQIISQSKYWRRYYFTPEILKENRFKDNIGQEQMWFLGEVYQFSKVDLKRSQGEFQEAKLMTIEELISNYSQWKKMTFIDFCREIGLVTF